MTHGKLSDLKGVGPVAHRRAQNRDDDASFVRTRGEPQVHGLHDLIQGQATLDMKLRGETHFGVHDAVSGQIDGALVGHTFERVGRLHHADRVRERL